MSFSLAGTVRDCTLSAASDRFTAGEPSTDRPQARVHDRRGVSRILVLPKPKHDPSSRLEEYVGFAVPVPVALELRPPELGVRSRPGCVRRTGMPETAVDEDGDRLGREGDIDSPPWRTIHWTLYAETEAETMQRGAESQLGRGSH